MLREGNECRRTAGMPLGRVSSFEGSRACALETLRALKSPTPFRLPVWQVLWNPPQRGIGLQPLSLCMRRVLYSPLPRRRRSIRACARLQALPPLPAVDKTTGAVHVFGVETLYPAPWPITSDSVSANLADSVGSISQEDENANP